MRGAPSPKLAINKTIMASKSIPGTRTIFRPNLSERYPISGVNTMPAATSNPKYSPLLKSVSPKSLDKYDGKKVIKAINAIARIPPANVITQISGFFKIALVWPIRS